MENKNLLIIYVICWMIYVGIVHTYAARFRLSGRMAAASHLVPSAVAVLMSVIFLIMGGATVRQLAGGPGAGLWSLWVALWPLLLLVTFASTFGFACAFVALCFQKSHWIWLPILGMAAALSAFAFMTVMGNFPDA